jgi:hypothetical protein
MSGLYPDVPGHRFAYDVDGTLVRSRGQQLQWQTLSAADAARMNDEDQSDWMAWATGASFVGASGVYLNVGDDRTTGTSYLVFIFPQLRNLTGYHLNVVYGQANQPYAPSVMQVSTDTTDGTDGTWTTIHSPWIYTQNAINPYQRTAITAVTGADGIKGVRFAVAKGGPNVDGNDRTQVYMCHLYGTLVGGNNGLRFWHPTSDIVIPPAHFDFGDLPQGTITTKQFRLKNTSTQQANDTVVSAEGQTGSDTGLVTGLTFSLDDAVYGSTITVPTIAAGAISPVLYARRTVGAAEAGLIRAARLKAVPGSWS